MRIDLRPHRDAALVDLSNLELFAGCTRAELIQVATLTTKTSVAAGKILLHEGSYGAEALIILEGSAAVTHGVGDDVEPIAMVGRGDLIGEISLLTGATRTAAVTALTDCSVLAMSPREFATLCTMIPGVGARIRNLAAERQAHMQTNVG